MQVPRRACLLRIFVGESDRWQGAPLFEALVMRARMAHLAGATVMRCPMGFGASSRLHTARILRLSEDLPIVIDIVDAREKIEAFLPVVEEMVEHGLVTLEDVEVMRYGARGNAGPEV